MTTRARLNQREQASRTALSEVATISGASSTAGRGHRRDRLTNLECVPPRTRAQGFGSARCWKPGGRRASGNDAGLDRTSSQGRQGGPGIKNAPISPRKAVHVTASFVAANQNDRAAGACLDRRQNVEAVDRRSHPARTARRGRIMSPAHRIIRARPAAHSLACRSVSVQRSPTSLSRRDRCITARDSHEKSAAAPQRGRASPRESHDVARIGAPVGSRIGHVLCLARCRVIGRHDHSSYQFSFIRLSLAGLGAGWHPFASASGLGTSRAGRRMVGPEITMRPILFVIPGLNMKVHSYGVMILLACFAALGMALRRAPRED